MRRSACTPYDSVLTQLLCDESFVFSVAGLARHIYDGRIYVERKCDDRGMRAILINQLDRALVFG